MTNRVPMLLLLLVFLGCSREDVVRVQNVERAVTTWRDDTKPEGRTHLCLEYATPAEKLQATKAALNVPIGERNVSVSYASAQSLASIYSVGEILQFGHAALYRLCEASGNHSVTPEEYEKLFRQTLENVNGLLRLQLTQFRASIDTRLVDLRDQVAAKDAEICRGLGSAGADTDRLHHERGDLTKRFDELKEQGTDAIHLSSAPPTSQDDATIRVAIQALKKIASNNPPSAADKVEQAKQCGQLKPLYDRYKDSSCHLFDGIELRVLCP